MTTTELALPTSGDSSTWTEQEKALVEAAGLTRKQGNQVFLADRPTVEAFLAHCRRTGLDPIARQIYAIYRGGKWGIQISIDGARLVAERSGQYEGQTPVEWTADGVTWTQVWLSDTAPKAARVGIYRTGFREPLWAVATWDSYAVTDSNGNVTSMWKKFGPLMLGKCAEMLGLRKAFPQDLSGLYSTEEMAQAEARTPSQEPPKSQSRADVPERDWAADIAAVGSVEALTGLYRDAQRDGQMGDLLPAGEDGVQETVEAALWRRKGELEKPAQEPLEGTEPGKPAEPRAWLVEARKLEFSEDVLKLHDEAVALGAHARTVGALYELAAKLPSRPVDGGPGWAPMSDDVEPPEADAADAAQDAEVQA